MYTQILIPLDGSEVAEQVLPYARPLARALKIPVELLGVIDIDALGNAVDAEAGRYLDSVVIDAMRSSEEYLKEIAGTFGRTSVNWLVEKGRPAEGIIGRAAVDRSTLIVMATHGRSGIGRWLLGSVAEKVLRGSSNPLLLVRARKEAKVGSEATMKSIVVPLDGSELAETVLPAVVDLARRMNLEVILIRAHVLPLAAYYGADEAYIARYEELRTQMKKKARGYLKNKVDEVRALGVRHVSYIMLEGSGADAIIGFARTTPDNLVASFSGFVLSFNAVMLTSSAALNSAANRFAYRYRSRLGERSRGVDAKQGYFRRL
jgi:nucleotide-binding universal stress UspA family protein